MKDTTHNRWRTYSSILIGVGAAAIWLLVLDRVFTLATADEGEDHLSYRGLLSLLGALGIVELGLATLWVAMRGLSALVASKTKRKLWSLLSAALVPGAITAYPFYLVGTELSSGDWIAQQSYAWLFRVAPAAVGALSVAVLFAADFYLWSRSERRIWWRWPFFAATLLGSAFLAGVNVVVWFGLYPRLHTAFFILSALFSLLALAGMTLRATVRVDTRASIAFACVLGLALTCGTVAWATMNRSTRSEVIGGAATCVDTVRAMASTGPRRALMLDALQNLQVNDVRAKREAELLRGQLLIPPDWNIAWIINDALRSDALPPNRTGKNKIARNGDSPFIDKWLEGAVRFENVYSQAACTGRSMPPSMKKPVKRE